ncbi:efflux RND transporter permease subunit [Halovivax cerinus]|uniref:RND family transporter n=1 Tax=Halovivax cerinus TaxID=1487865 RepID=A0ABD5NNN8_9EURY|nr:MMPL family transporter [Halovivax cerinus]
MSWVDRLTGAIMGHSKAVIGIMLILTVVMGAGAGMVDQTSSLDAFQSDTEQSQALTYAQNNFGGAEQNGTTAQVIVRGDDVLTKESLVSQLELQQSFRDDETINRTLADEQPSIGVANLVAITAISGDQQRELQEEAASVQQRRDELNATAGALSTSLDSIRDGQSSSARDAFETANQNSPVELNESHYETFERAVGMLQNAQNQTQVETAYQVGTQGVLETEYDQLSERSQRLRDRQEAMQNGSTPSLADQIDAIESMNGSTYERTLDTVLSEDETSQLNGLAFMPVEYDVGSTSANATMLLVTHQMEGGGGGAQTGSMPQSIVDAQLEMRSIANADDAPGTEVMIFGGGVMTEEINNSMGDSLSIVGPLALLFVVLALIVAYRDVLDILLGVFGIVAVLVWTFGFMGWAGISFNQIFIAVPVLLIGLSIDYAIHIFMRHREQRHDGGEYGEEDTRGSMRIALVGVGIALVWVTATTVIGFLSNLTSPVPPIQDFGVVSAAGITAALLIFGSLIPAIKVELDEFFENRGFDRKKRAFGTGGGRFSQVLGVGSAAARRAPIAVILIALLVSAGGAYGATQVDTTFDQEDFIAEDPPEWTKNLPEPFKPAEYTMKENLDFVNENFVREDAQAQIVVQGDGVTDPQTLQRIHEAEREAANNSVVATLGSGDADLESPVRTMQAVAAENESFNATLTAADTNGDMVPDQNVEGVYDALFATAPTEASNVIDRTDDGEYQGVRMVISTQGTAAMSDVTDEMQQIADDIDGTAGVTAIATGQSILFDIISDQLMDTVIESLLITLVAVFAFLMLTYRITEGSATLGAVTLMPVVFSVSWILGTMYLTGIPFNVMTGMITSLTVGLGVAYSIHVSERYNLELERTGSVWEAMSRTITGTGGALLGSAATTVGGFGVLAFAILPPLQQFGIITGMTIIYAFLASVLVLPSLLVLWTKYLGPDDVSFDAAGTNVAASDGGQAGSADVSTDGLPSDEDD